uniref:RBR-type E3 ubiquitin transferase n=1 Tax=Panagrolaimus superbus TaxID=310955 RepID=A0A914ZAJ3_9BILA
MDVDDYSDNSEGESDYDIDYEMQEEASSPSSSTELQLTVIKSGALVDEMEKTVNEAVAVLGYPSNVCKIVLHTFLWDTNKLFEKFYEAETPEDFFKKYKIDIPKSNETDLVTKKGDCMICFDKKNKLIGLSCQHLFCSECWNSYLLTRFRSEGDPYAKCPDFSCHLYVDDPEKLLNNPEEKAFYRRLLVQSFVNTNPHLQWCPHEKCDKVVKVKSRELGAVTCECGETFCFLCSQEWHEPLTCQLLSRWIKKYSGDSETMKWVSVNTKDCPKCNAAIEKNGGCNHMVCRNKSCGFEFCWFCMQDWKAHGYNNQGCNKFKENTQTDQASKFREQLRRYMHYYDRFANHRKSLQAETDLLIQISLKIEQMQSQLFSWIETEFLRDAVRILNQCRRSLMYAYAFAYYLPSSNEKEIFEENQADLERATEELSGVLEREIENDDIIALKQKVSLTSDVATPTPDR